MSTSEKEKMDEKDTSPSEKLDDICESGGVIAEKDGSRIHCLTVIGQIEGHYELSEGQKATKYEHIIPLLVSIEESDEIDGLLLVLNTMGGDVEAGLAIAEMVAGMKKPTQHEKIVYSSVGNNDHTPRPCQRTRYRRTSDLLLL